MRVRWLPHAADNLEAIHATIAQDSPRAADQTVDRIVGAVTRLEAYPNSGRPGRVFGTRELVIPGTSYIVPYRLRRGTVEVLRVYHAAQRWPSSFE